VVYAGLIWLRIDTSGGLLWTRKWTFVFHKMLRSSWVAAQMAASQEGLSSMEWVYLAKDQTPATVGTLLSGTAVFIAFIFSVTGRNQPLDINSRKPAIHLNIITPFATSVFQPVDFLQVFELKCLCSFFHSHVCYNARRSHPSWLHHLDNIWRTNYEHRCYFIPLGLKYPPDQPFPNTLESVCLFLNVRDEVSHPG
jgi:hypothetical protein